MSLRGGRSRNNSAVSTSSKGRKQPLPGEKELESILADAEYEVHQDPYRGLQSQQQSLETGTQITTPWNACLWGTLQPEDVEAKDMDSVAVVRHIGHCACPSLKAWTKTLQEGNNKKKKGKKRARLSSPTYYDRILAVGIRPSETNYRCPCDYNPLCLGSLGGVVNDILIERSKDTDMEEPEPMDIDEPEKPQVAQHEKINVEATCSAKGHGSRNSRVQAQSVLEQLTSPKNNEEQKVVELEKEKEKASTDQSENSTTDVFAFLDEDSNKKAPLAKLKPLQRNQELVLGNPADIYTADLPNIDLSDIKYSPATETRLKSLRHSIVTDANKIRSYTRKTFCLKDQAANGDDRVWTVEKYMQALAAWQKSLGFVNPINGERAIRNDQMAISLPPGIENLGATCYLNTQLQCLAQNPAFLNGIFSWRVVNSTHNMNSVMSKMQLLFAQMVLGGECKISTLDFSNALGLEHNEQQDPTEFARLLFERMEESFQQCDKDGDLANLLRRIFQGATTYETICMTCQHSSERSECFMDLNLPIVKREKANDKLQNDIKDFFGKSAETDVQYCLDQYICAEILDGDNQYFCSACDCKRDAQRVLKLTELPPVLNVQLSRYVFDITQYVKKKLSDKVLLPTTLAVPKSDGSMKKYTLCAVMRHQGTSAYAGHYVAEAMDWLTGQWFEFNDETVKLLSDGPSCSYDPDENETTDKKTTMLSGSQDAYNMYYVDEKFLAQNALDEVSRRASHCAAGNNYRNSETINNVLAEVSEQRNEKYVTLSE
jgi:ubiquitin C-terminal hydrolase